MKDVVARLQRELPDTDKDRYDIAYQRGRAQARSALLAGGLAVGSALGAGLMWLFDPARGAGRRAQLTERLGGVRSQVSRTVSGKTEDLGNRVSGFAIERGLKQPDDGTPDKLATAGASGASGAATGTAGATPDYGEGYREGFGATEHDPTAPGSQVPDPIQADEIMEYGSSGPVAGAGHEERTSVVSRSAEEEEEEAAGSR